jgi:hypothetical protein
MLQRLKNLRLAYLFDKAPVTNFLREFAPLRLSFPATTIDLVGS